MATDRQATFRDVFGVPEYRALFGAAVLSWIGDYFAKVAVAVLVFHQTGSAALSAASFAISYLPWVVVGPVLAAVAERHPYRRVMIVCDVASMATVALMALPGLPLPILLLLLLGTATLAPPSQAARSAMVAQLLTGDRYVQAISLQNMSAQATQVMGYAVGGVVATAVAPRGALLINAATFAGSALVLWYGVRPRPAAIAAVNRRSLLRETGDGMRLVFGHRVMRPIALMVFCLVAVTIVPEGLATAWSPEFGGGSATTGLLMAAIPLGTVVGGVVNRVTTPGLRLKLIKPLLLACPALLVPVLVGPPFAVVFLLVVGTGVASVVMVSLNGSFVRVLPGTFRARAFGIMRAGMQITLAIAVLTTGALAERFPVSVVVGAWALGGLALMCLAIRTWPGGDVIEAEVARITEPDRPGDPSRVDS